MNRRTVALVARVIGFVMMAQMLLPVIWYTPVQGAATPDIRIQFLASNNTATEDQLPDHGETYGARNGYTYGWNFDHTPYTVTDAAYGHFIQLQPGSVWEIALESGTYDVAVTVGNAVYGSTNTIRVENVVYWDREALAAGELDMVKKRVQLSDGRLTLQGDAYSAGTSLRNVEITKIEPAIRTMNLPEIGLPIVQNKRPGDKVILSGTQQNEHNSIPAIPVPGLNPVIDTYMDAQLTTMEQRIGTMRQQAVSCGGCNAEALQSAIQGSSSDVVVVKGGQLNLDASATFGSLSKPVYLILDGINTNQNLTLTVYGTLAVLGNLNANTNLTLRAYAPDDPSVAGAGDLWVGGSFHLNNNSTVQVAGDLMAGGLIYNNGQLNVQADRLLVSGSMHINTKVEMSVTQEMMVGTLVSNNDVANIRVNTGDLFIRDNVNVNNHLMLQTGGVVAIGGNITANRKPLIETGAGTSGQTKLKYTSYGLKAEYYSDTNLNGDRFVAVDANVDVNNKLPISAPGLSDGNMSARWTGQIVPYYTETYDFQTDVRGGVRLWVNNELIIDQWEATGNGTYTGSIPLEGGASYDIQLEYANRGGQPKISLAWDSDTGPGEVVPQRQLSPFRMPDLVAIPTEGDVTLFWTTSFNAEGYELEADGIVYPLGVQSSHTHDALDAGTLHHYRVRAVSGDIKGEWSTPKSLWTLPDVPHNIELSATSSSITLNWDEVIGATGYEIETYNTVIDNGHSTTYTELDINPNFPRTFRIRAYNTSGSGQWSALVAKSTLPGAPGRLYSESTDVSIDLHWDAVSGADYYDVEVDGQVIGGIAVTHYLHESLLPNTAHTYRVRARNSEGASPWSTALTTVTLPSVPQHLRATASGDRITLSWDEVTGADNYQLEVDGAIVGVGFETTYIHVDLQPNTTYTYRVRAERAGIVGLWSDAIASTTLSGVPINFRAASASHAILLSWDPVIGASSYEVEVDGIIVPIGLNTFYEHGGLIPFTEHVYRVRAVSGAGAGPWSDYLHASTALALPQLTAQTLSKSSIAISWTAVPGATAYELLVDGEIVGMGDATTFLHQDLLPYSWHVYRVRALGGELAGPWSEALTQSTLLASPVIVKLEAADTQMTVIWEAVPGATGYEIEADGAVVDVGTNTTFVHAPLQPNTTHTYRLRAKNEDGETVEWSEWSALAVKMTSPPIPMNLQAVASARFIELQWDATEGSLGYELEINGQIVSDITDTRYVHSDLEPNTMYDYRVRSANADGNSPWSDKLSVRTTPELTVDVGQGVIFNFVIVVPAKPDLTDRTITVTYDPSALDIVDLYAATPESELTTGPIRGTNLTVVEAVDGKIVYQAADAAKTIVAVIRFAAKSNDDSIISYTVE